MSPRSFAIALALTITPGLALAQADDPATGQPAMPPNFGDPEERAAPAAPDTDADAVQPGRSGPADRGGMGPGGMSHRGMMDHAEMMRRHHGDDARGSASISIRSGDRALMIRCGDTPIPDCVAGAEPLIELMQMELTQ